jgi:hypothetical protein
MPLKQMPLQSRGLKIKKRKSFKELASEEECICLTGKHLHSPSVLEMQIINTLTDKSLVNHLFCVDCTKLCDHRPSIHVYIEIQEKNQAFICDLATSIRSFIEREHDDNCAEIIFFSSNTMKPFTDEDHGNLRFQMRDSVIAGKLLHQIIYTWKHSFEDEIDFSETGKCTQCFCNNIMTPLAMKSFNVIEEWYLETPLTCQILFENFINKYTLQKSDNKESFLKKKYTRLYSEYDSLLNVANKNYCGIIQDLNTQELSMNYQSISTVFHLTSSGGLTQSLPTAENKLKKNAVSEKTYFCTYLRKYPMTYHSLAGIKSVQVSLRDCVLVLMMDNLVRIKKHSDPDPGESRSRQICTLPITLKGLPLDSIQVETWHDKDCDNSDFRCTCKMERKLTKNDISELVLTLSEEQKHFFILN